MVCGALRLLKFLTYTSIHNMMVNNMSGLMRGSKNLERAQAAASNFHLNILYGQIFLFFK